MPDKLKVGIAGYGAIGSRRHIVCAQHPLLQVVAVCDRNLDGPSMLTHDVAAYNNTEQLLDNDLDILVVCLPNDIAPATTIAGLERGLHVFCEKPPGRTVEDIQRVRRLEAQHPSLKLKYGFNHRYHHSVRNAYKLVRSGDLGNVINLRGVYGKSAFIPWPRPQSGDSESINIKYWRTSQRVAGGGILLDQGIHMLDLMHLFIDQPFSEISAFVDNSYWKHDVEDNAYAIMRSPSGIVAMLHSSATLWRHRFTLDISLTNGSIQLSGILTGTKSYGEERLTVMHRQDESNGLPTEHATTYVQDTSWSDEIADFVESILKDKPVAIGNSADALTSMQTVHGIYQADPRWRPRDQHIDASASEHRSHSGPGASSSTTERDRPRWKSRFQVDWR